MADCPQSIEAWDEFGRWQEILEQCCDIDQSFSLEELLHAFADRMAVYDGPLAPGELRRVRALARNRERKHRRRRDLETLAHQLGEHHLFRLNGQLVGFPDGQRSPADRAALKDELQWTLSKLSDRETAIFVRIADGWTNAEIATDLGICPGAVRMCVKRCRERMRRLRISAPRGYPGLRIEEA